MKMWVARHGVRFTDDNVQGDIDVIALYGDKRGGQSLLIKAKHEEIEIRVTPTGRLRVSRVRRAGILRSAGVS